MKPVTILFLGLALFWAILIKPIFSQSKVVAKRTSLRVEKVAQAKHAVETKALATLRSGHANDMPEVQSVIAKLEKGSLLRIDFAKELDRQGESDRAYKLESERAHYLELNTPDDNEMKFYAELSEKSGHPEEAQWARGRMGVRGHFRVWELGDLDYLSVAKRGMPSWLFNRALDRQVSEGKRLYPGLSDEMEAFRARVQSSSPQDIHAFREEVERQIVRAGTVRP